MFCRNIRYFWKKDLGRVFRSSALVEDPPAIPNEMVFQEVAASSSYRLRIEVIVTERLQNGLFSKLYSAGVRSKRSANCQGLPSAAFYAKP